MELTYTKLGKYELIKEIGRGSMGVVYVGHDPFADQPVAIKVAHAESLQDEEWGSRYRKMFFNEAHTAGLEPISKPHQTHINKGRNRGLEIGSYLLIPILSRSTTPGSITRSVTW
jgi:serine/threonine protein kinase